MVRMPFGRHKGRPLAEIETQYLSWVLREADAADESLKDAIRRELAGRTDTGGRRKVRGRATDAGAAYPPVDWSGVVATWYRQLALVYHPDRGGTTRDMQVVNDCVDRLRKLVGAT